MSPSVVCPLLEFCIREKTSVDATNSKEVNEIENQRSEHLICELRKVNVIAMWIF